jgi:O-antigen ligase
MIARNLATPGTATADTRLLRAARWALNVTVAALPLYVVRWRYGPLPTTLLETLIIITVVLYVIARWRGGVRRPVHSSYEIAILVLLAAGAVSVLVAKDHRGALGLYRAYFIEPVLLFYVAIDLLRDESHVKRLVLSFAAGSSAFGILNLAVFTQALMAHSVHVGSAPNALYGDANYVAMYLEPPVALAAGLLLLGPSRAWRISGGLWLLFAGGALIVMFSKGSYLALAVLAVVVLITVPRWRLPLLGAVAVAAVAASQIPLFMARLATIPSSLNGREELFGSAAGMIRDHPLFGLGLGGYTYMFRQAESE